ncbi:Pyroglutamylated Rf-Amide Peptide Receptor [Manis pentadactyla]|nr:Pyroglutamylated Rf-Amide Peptide Receptor [Manis pentadactyla]
MPCGGGAVGWAARAQVRVPAAAAEERHKQPLIPNKVGTQWLVSHQLWLCGTLSHDVLCIGNVLNNAQEVRNPQDYVGPNTGYSSSVFFKKIWMVLNSTLGPASRRVTLMHKGLNKDSKLNWVYGKEEGRYSPGEIRGEGGTFPYSLEIIAFNILGDFVPLHQSFSTRGIWSLKLVGALHVEALPCSLPLPQLLGLSFSFSTLPTKCLRSCV